MSQNVQSITEDDGFWSYDSILEYIDARVITFPLPEQTDPAQCRDEFLKSIFKPEERIIPLRREIKRKSSMNFIPTTAEGLAILNMMIKSAASSNLGSVSQYRPSLTSAQMEKLYTICLYQFQKAAIQFLSVRLKKQLITQLQIFPDETVETPHKLFHWSLEFFLRRRKVNQLYLDVLVMDRSRSQLDCAKFCTDINEILRLLDLISKDFCQGHDLCTTISIIK